MIARTLYGRDPVGYVLACEPAHVVCRAGAPTYTENLYLKVRELRVSRRGRGSLLWLSKWEDAVERRRCSEARKT